ncbi:MAG: peptidyl-prolyl cis-trans isomerase [Spirochaetaceae bacterium]|nr:peptidyl-prolyl cis-trans isomerase [Spirochaetaceae bacterium]
MADKKKPIQSKGNSGALFEKNGPRAAARKTALWIGSVVILAFATITFVFLPAAAGGMSSKTPVYGSYARKPIAQTAGSLFMSFLSQSSGGASSLFELRSQYRQAFDSTVMRLAYQTAVEDSGYVVPEKAIERGMVPYFYDENGVYSLRLFNAAPESRKTALYKFLTENLTVMRYNDDLFGSSTEKIGEYKLFGRKETKREANFVKRMGAIQRGFDLAAFKLADVPDSEAAKFVDGHQDLFVLYNLSVVSVSGADGAKGLLARIKNQEITFDDAVKELSQNYYSGSGGKLSAAYRYEIQNILTDAASLDALAALRSGDLSGVVKTNTGYSVFRCDGDPVQPAADNGDLLGKARQYLLDYERGIIEDYFLGRARDFAVSAVRDGFDAACAEFAVTKVEASPFPLNYNNNPLVGGGPSVAELSGAASNENFLKTAFSLKAGEISTPVVLGSSVVILRLREIVDVQAAAGEEEAPAESNGIWGGGNIVYQNSDGTTSSFSMHEFYIQQFDQGALSETIKRDKRLKDRFDREFDRLFSES